MRIGLVSPYSLDVPGGVATHIAGLTQAFLGLGHEVIVIAPRSWSRLSEVPAGRREIGRPIRVRANGSHACITIDVTRRAEVRRVVAGERLDVLHVHEPFIPILPILALERFTGTRIATFHTYRPGSPWYRAFRPVLERVARRLDARIAVSQAALRSVAPEFPGTYVTLPNGVDLELIDAAQPWPWASDGKRRILFAGRFDEPRKGLRVLADALDMVADAIPDLEVVVAGSGDAPKARAMMASRTRTPVRLLTGLSDHDIRRCLKSVDACCSPALGGESFGMVLLEAMAAGLPVVASDIPGYRDLLTHERDGLLTAAADPTALAHALIKVLSDRTYAGALGTTGRGTAARYSWAHVAPRVLATYLAASR